MTGKGTHRLKMVSILRKWYISVLILLKITSKQILYFKDLNNDIKIASD